MNISIYILGNYKLGDADGLAEFNAQNVSLLKDLFDFHFIQLNGHKHSGYYNVEVRDGVTVHTFGVTKLFVNKIPLTLVSWLKKLPKTNIVFHLSHIYNLTNYFIARHLVRLEIPYLITPHDSYVYSTAYQAGKPIFKKVYRKVFINLFDRYVLENAAVIHGITDQCLINLKDFTKKTVTVVNNQVGDVASSFTPAAIKRQVLFLGRFNVYTKGIDLALKAFKLYKIKSGVSNDVNFFLVGPADRFARAACISLCKVLKLAVGKEVVFTGKVSTAERTQHLYQSQVYLHLARTEGFGLSIAQALSNYKPVIVSKQVPISDKILKHKAGFVVDSPEDASDALVEIFGLPSSGYDEMSRNARQCYEEEFHPTVIKPQLIELYLKCLKGNQTGNTAL